MILDYDFSLHELVNYSAHNLKSLYLYYNSTLALDRGHRFHALTSYVASYAHAGTLEHVAHPYISFFFFHIRSIRKSYRHKDGPRKLRDHHL